MCTPGAWALRKPLPEEERDLPADLEGEGFRLVAHSHKIYTPSGAPAFFFHVVGADGTRIGLANVIVEPDKAKVHDVGHLCATLGEDYLDVELLSRVADALVGYEFAAGLPEVLIVVPTAHEPSVEACILLKPASSAAVQTGAGEPGAAYTYSR